MNPLAQKNTMADSDITTAMRRTVAMTGDNPFFISFIAVKTLKTFLLY
jgi:hypothetical protein